MDYRKEYEKWLASPALSEDERAELRALEGNDKEIKARFYGPLEFGTAGLRGTCLLYTSSVPSMHRARKSSPRVARSSP